MEEAVGLPHMYMSCREIKRRKALRNFSIQMVSYASLMQIWMVVQSRYVIFLILMEIL